LPGRAGARQVDEIAAFILAGPFATQVATLLDSGFDLGRCSASVAGALPAALVKAVPPARIAAWTVAFVKGSLETREVLAAAAPPIAFGCDGDGAEDAPSSAFGEGVGSGATVSSL
jgi:hypothetical protein